MKQEKSQFSGYMLIAVFVVPLLIAIAMYLLRDHMPTMNTVSHGELIHPAEPIQAIEILLQNKTIITLNELKGKWTYLVYAPTGCHLQCEANLFKLRQSKAATGREINRIQSVLLLNDQPLNSEIASRNQKILIGQLKKLELESESGVDKELTKEMIYLLDPHGNMMMKYDLTATSKGILKDIKKLLKISNIG